MGLMAIVCAGVAAWQGRRAPGALATLLQRPPQQSADQQNAGLDVVFDADAIAVVVDGMDGDSQGSGAELQAQLYDETGLPA